VRRAREQDNASGGVYAKVQYVDHFTLNGKTFTFDIGGCEEPQAGRTALRSFPEVRLQALERAARRFCLGAGLSKVRDYKRGTACATPRHGQAFWKSRP